MEQTDKEPHWFASVALSGLGRLKAHHGGKLVCVRDPVYHISATVGSQYRTRSPGHLPGWVVSLVFFATILADCHLVSQ